jgi:hypothetical protein
LIAVAVVVLFQKIKYDQVTHQREMSEVYFINQALKQQDGGWFEVKLKDYNHQPPQPINTKQQLTKISVVVGVGLFGWFRLLSLCVLQKTQWRFSENIHEKLHEPIIRLS